MKKTIKAAVVSIAALIVCVLLVFVLLKGKNTYETPLKHYEKYVNGKYTDILEMYKDFRGGVAGAKIDDAVRTLKNADGYKKQVSGINEYMKSMSSYYKEVYGENAKMTISIDSKEAIAAEELKQYEEEIHTSCAEIYKELIVDLEDYRDVFWDNIEFEVGLSGKQGEKLLKACEGIVKQIEGSKVSEGYRLNCTVKLSGAQDGFDEITETFIVLKVNGKWVMYDMFKVAMNVYEIY